MDPWTEGGLEDGLWLRGCADREYTGKRDDRENIFDVKVNEETVRQRTKDKAGICLPYPQ